MPRIPGEGKISLEPAFVQLGLVGFGANDNVPGEIKVVSQVPAFGEYTSQIVKHHASDGFVRMGKPKQQSMVFSLADPTGIYQVVIQIRKAFYYFIEDIGMLG